jgi:hypothetical protein
MFSNINKERTTKRVIQYLRQKGVAITYATKF